MQISDSGFRGEINVVSPDDSAKYRLEDAVMTQSQRNKSLN